MERAIKTVGELRAFLLDLSDSTPVHLHVTDACRDNIRSATLRLGIVTTDGANLFGTEDGTATVDHTHTCPVCGEWRIMAEHCQMFGTGCNAYTEGSRKACPAHSEL